MMWSIAICDDNAAETALVRASLERFGAEKGLALQIRTYSSGNALVFAHEDRGLRFDLILLDVLMEQSDGIEVATMLRRIGVRTPIIFCTTSRDYAVESYEVEAAGYLVKPLDYEKLKPQLERLLKRENSPRLALHVHGGIYNPCYSQILYFESRDHVTYVILETGESLRCAESLASLEKMLAHDRRFFRCHKAFLVNMDYIERVEDMFILTGGYQVPYRVREKKKITDHYYSYFLQRNLKEGSPPATGQD